MTLGQSQRADKLGSITINKRGGMRLYCVFNQSRISWGSEYHVRQMKEDKRGNRFPLVNTNKRAFIKAKNGLFYGIINDNEVIAISDDINVVEKRLKHAESSIEYTVYDADRKRRYKTIDSYYNSLLPRIFRITSSNAKNHDLIIALNSIKNNERSHVELYYSLEDLYERFDRLKNKNYYVHITHLPDVDKERLGGIEALDIPAEFKDISDLRAAIEARQKAGSHEEYIKKVKDELIKIKLINEDIFEKAAEDSYFHYNAEYEEETSDEMADY